MKHLHLAKSRIFPGKCIPLVSVSISVWIWVLFLDSLIYFFRFGFGFRFGIDFGASRLVLLHNTMGSHLKYP
jgi:hypothetical protein